MSDRPTEKVMVTYTVRETPDEQKQRIKERKPLQTYSFMVSGNATKESGDAKKDQSR